MAGVKQFFDLVAWQKGHMLVLEIYKATNKFPEEEIYGLTSQIKRAAISVTANIAEGFGRYHYKDKEKFYYQARGSLTEVVNFILLARDLEFIMGAHAEELLTAANEVEKVLNGLIRSIEKQREKKT